MGEGFTASRLAKIGLLLFSIFILYSIHPSASFAAGAAPDTFITKSKSDLPSSAMTNIAYGNNLYIAVGYYGAIIKSTDAENWSNVKTQADVNYTGVGNPSSFVFYGAAYGSGKFVVTGNEGVILTSTDGTNWTQRTSGVTKTITNVKYLDHNGVSAFYALTEGKLLKSADGITWTAVVPTGLNATTALTQITVGNNGNRLAVGDTSGFIYSTTNGTTWTSARPVNPEGNPSIGTNMLVWMKDQYYISDPWGYMWTSTNLSAFTLAGAPFKQNSSQVNNQMFNGFYDGTKYYLFGFQAPYGYGAVYTSTDGNSWTMQPYNNFFVTQSSSFLNGKYFRLGNEGLMVSSNGSDWSYKWGGTYNEVIHDGSKYIAVGKQGSDGAIWTSNDLTSWNPASVSARANSFNAVAYGNGKYVAVGDWNQDKTTVATSANGSAWTVQTGVTDSTLFSDIAFGNGKFVAVGTKGYTSPSLKTSADGVAWSDPVVPNQAIQALFSVTFTNNQFIALGYSYDNSANVNGLSIWTSPDGTDWTNRSSSYPNQTDAISDILYDGTKYILLGYDPSYKMFSRTSTDLATWSAPTVIGNDSLFGLTPVLGAKGNNIYALGAVSGTYKPEVYYSNDQGTTWQNANVDLTDAQAYSLMSVNGQVIISGNSQLVLTTTSPVSSTISPDTANFDKNVAVQADVTTALTLNGNTLTSIKNGAAALVDGTDYTVTGNTVTIEKSYLAAQTVGTTTLTFEFSAGNPQTLAITVSDSTPKNSELSTNTANFDKKASAQADVSVTLTLKGNTLSSIKNGTTALVLGTDYTLTNELVTLKKEYLATLPEGVTNLVFTFSAGNPQTLAITVSDSTPKNSELSTNSANFDKKASAQADVSLTLTLKGNALSSIKNGTTTLVLATDYTLTNEVVALKKEYLASLPEGITNLVFTFSAGNPQTLAITVSDSTPKNSDLSTNTASFDKKASAQADVSVTLTLKGNTLSSIKNGTTDLLLGTDYTLTNDVVTLKKEYLATLPEGVTNLVFTFSAGNPQTLEITVSDTTPKNSELSTNTASFDKKASAQADVSVTLTLKGNTLSSIKNGATALVLGTDYTLANDVVTLKKEYLATLPEGVTNLVFTFSAGNPQ
ncbi:X2-like carbohydrate binding domain-containing protein, partial [Paenibacillus sp. NPDC058177]|uniref:X2-like carbohydrate binding domain-containing protein n=1 Tax=Paenibacillus sp. NPDC058177 TaxID=3346369 RepID=UPI0036D8D766